MKRALTVFAALLVVAFMGASASALAAESKSMSKAMAMTMSGTIIDTKCATANKATLGEFVKTHPEDCALACKDSGYNLYSEGKLYKFDKASSGKVYKFLEKADSKLNVMVEVVHGKGGVLKLVSIKNAE